MSSTAAPASPPAGALQVFQAPDSSAPCGGCLGRGVSGPLVIHRRTPDHPPYAEMIQVALRALAEEYGSTEDAISRRIAADYPDLPWAHDRLLHHYLRRTVAAGDIAAVAPGRYALLTPSAASVAGLNPVHANNPSPSLRITSFPGAGPASTPQRSPSDNEAAVDCGAGEDLENQKAVLFLTAASPAVDGAHRPHRLPVHSASDPAAGDGFAGGQDEQPAEEDLPRGNASHWNAQNVGKKKKGRGRPPLRKRGKERPPSRANYQWEWVSSVDAIDPTTGAIRTDIAEGEIPISLIPSTHGPDSSPVLKTPEVPRKRCSRSPKIKPTVFMSDLVSNDRDTLLMNADSFSEDFDRIKLSGDSYLSWSLGDGSSFSGDKVVSQCGTTERPKLILRLPVKRKESMPEDSFNSDLTSLANQLTVRVPKRPRTSTDHNPRKIRTKMSKEMVMSRALVQSTEQVACARMSSVPLIQSTVRGEPIAQSSEQMICALPVPATMKEDSRPKQMISCQPKIDGWVQVLLAVQPTSPNLRRSKKNKDMSCCNERKLVKYTDDLIPSKLLLAREVQNAARVDSCLQPSMSKHSDGDNLIEGKVDENIVEVDRCVHLISALHLDHIGSIHMTGEKIPNVDQGAKHVAEYLEKRVANKELDNRPQTEGSILEYHMQQSRPEQTEVNETDSRMCLQVLPSNLQMVNVTKPPMVEPLPEYAAEPYVTSGCLQSQTGSIYSVGESTEKPHLQHLDFLDDLQYKGMNGLDCGNYVKAQHDQIILQDTSHFDRDKSEKHIHEPVVEFSAKTHKNLDSFRMHQLQEESYDELCIRRIPPDLELSRGALETDASHILCNKRCINLCHEEQQKLQITLLSEAEIVQAEEHASVTESEHISDYCFQVQELDNRMQGDGRHSAEEGLQMKDPARSHVHECLQEEHKTKEDVHIVGTSTTMNQHPGDCNLHLEDHASRSHGSQSLQMFTSESSRAVNFVSLSNESNQNLPPELSGSEDSLQMEEASGLGDDGSLQGPDTEELASCSASQSIEERNMQLRKCKKRQRRLWFEG